MAQKTLAKTVIISVSIMVVFLGVAFLFAQTNLFIKHEGTTFTKRISVDELIGNEEATAGYIQVMSDDRTRSTRDWVSFDNNETFKYFSIAKGETLVEEIDVLIPTAAPSKRYYFQISATTIDGRTEAKEYSFFVG